MILLTSCMSARGPSVLKLPQQRTIHYVSSNQGNEGSTKIIGQLAENYSAAHPNVKYEFENVTTSALLQKIQLLAASNDLPDLFSFEPGSPLKQLADSGFVLDLEKTFKELGLYDQLNPAAVVLLKSMVGGKGLYALPLEMNIEGFWYNKELFAKYGLKEPHTWDEMLRAAETFKQHGIQPFSVGGEHKWPITRLINGYVIRKYGFDAMQRVSRGELRVTESGFVEAAQVVQDMGLKGYFGSNVNSVDNDLSVQMFLTGKSAMFYVGSWILRDLNDPDKNKIGTENIGFFNIPLVKGGKGTLDDWSMNAGLTTSFSAAAYDETMKDWIKEVFTGYGDEALNELGVIPGFRVEQVPDNIPPLTRMVQQKMNGVKNSALWFEAFFNTRTQTVAWNNAQLLVSSEMLTPRQYMEELQRAIDEQRNE